MKPLFRILGGIFLLAVAVLLLQTLPQIVHEARQAQIEQAKDEEGAKKAKQLAAKKRTADLFRDEFEEAAPPALKTKGKNKKMSTYIPSGSGTSAINGQPFVETGTYNTKPYYVYGPYYMFAQNTSGTAWIIHTTLGIVDPYDALYWYLGAASATPPTGVTWNGEGAGTYTGTDPAPTVALYAPSDTTAPTRTSAQVNTAGNIEITFSESITGSNDGFTINVDGYDKSTANGGIVSYGTAGAVLTLNMNVPIRVGQIVTDAYLKSVGNITDLVGIDLEDYAASSVTNNSGKYTSSMMSFV